MKPEDPKDGQKSTCCEEEYYVDCGQDFEDRESGSSGGWLLLLSWEKAQSATGERKQRLVTCVTTLWEDTR